MTITDLPDDNHRLILAALSGSAPGTPMAGSDLPGGDDVADGVFDEFVRRGWVVPDRAVGGPTELTLTASGRLAAKEAARWRDGAYRQAQAELAVLANVVHNEPIPTEFTAADVKAAYSRLERAHLIGIRRNAAGEVFFAWPSPEAEVALAAGSVPSRREQSGSTNHYDYSRQLTVTGGQGVVANQGDGATVVVNNVFSTIELELLDAAFEEIRAAVIASSVSTEERASALARLNSAHTQIERSPTRELARTIGHGLLANLPTAAFVAAAPHVQNLLQLLGG